MSVWNTEDEGFMREAIAEASKAEAAGDIPVGAVIVKDGAIIARAGNARKISDDPTAHAEVLAIREAAKVVGNWRLEGCTLYVTLEPCTMCAGALVLARVARVVYAAPDPKAGAVESLYEILSDTRLNHSPEVAGGLLAEKSADLLRDFFRARRGKKRAD
jgi:tRNA(adenine34) deaminase